MKSGQACRADRLYHYLLAAEADLPANLAGGLLPLDARPESARWRMIAEARPRFFRDLDAHLAEVFDE